MQTIKLMVISIKNITISFNYYLKFLKTMKKTLFFSALLGMATLLTSCSDETKEVTLNVSTTTISVEAAQATASFNITADIDWRVSVSDNWVSAAPTAGNGDATIMLVVQANDLTTSRATKIIVTGGDKSHEISLNQAAKPATPTPPAKATISGKDSNCPEGTATVTLTAEASGATSFVWYNGTTVIAGATANTYAVSASGTYFAAGVNADGEGQKSNQKVVRIYDDCTDSGDFQYDDLLGSYTATGDPSITQNPGPRTWNSTVNEPENGRDQYYIFTGFGGTQINIGVDIVNSTLSPNTYSVVARTPDGAAEGYLGVFYVVYEGEVGDLILIRDYTIAWNGRTQTIDWTGQIDGYDVMAAVLAFDSATGDFLGAFTDGYANLVFTRDEANGIRMEGTRIEGVKDPATGLIQHDMFKNIRSVKQVSMKDVNLTR
jgi:hypothetical protein